MNVPPPEATSAKSGLRVVEGELADALARRLTDAVDTIVDALAPELAGVAWEEQGWERLRESIRQLVLGFVQYLRVGDLEANLCERLREVVAPRRERAGASTAIDLVRSTRIRAVDLVGEVLEVAPTDPQRRLLERELGAFLDLLDPPELAFQRDDVGQLDDWLSYIESTGVDVS